MEIGGSVSDLLNELIYDEFSTNDYIMDSVDVFVWALVRARLSIFMGFSQFDSFNIFRIWNWGII